MSKRVLASLAAALLTCAAAPAAAQTPPDMIPVVVRSADHEARAALVRRYFEVIQFNKLMSTTMESSLEPSLADERIPADKRELIRAAALDAFVVVIPQMVDASVEMYAEIFTLAELEQLVAFYESPVGRSVTVKTVMMTQQTGDMIQRFTPVMEQEMMRQLCSRIDCSSIESAGRTAKGF